VCIDDTVIVCFSGPSAREQALRRSQELAQLLHDSADLSEITDLPSSGPFVTRG
jgi:hypothetical protein